MLYEKEIKQVVKLRKKQLGIPEAINDVYVSKLGTGENNINMLVVVHNKKNTKCKFAKDKFAKFKFNFRIPIWPWIEKNMKHEFNSLKVLPKGFGPEPILFDSSKKIFPKTYEILSFVEGRHLKKWTDKHLKMHAKKLAMLHKNKSRHWGKIGQKKKIFDLYKYLLKEMRGYKGNDAFIFDDKDIKTLTPKIKKYIKEKNHLFTSLKRFSMIHTDTCLVNTLFQKDEVKFIDWEWMRYGDNAEDLAQAYSEDLAIPPWIMKLSKKRADLYLNTYLKYNPDKTLKQRVEVWSIYIKFTALLYFKWKTRNYDKRTSNESREYYKKASKSVADNLKKKSL